MVADFFNAYLWPALLLASAASLSAIGKEAAATEWWHCLGLVPAWLYIVMASPVAILWSVRRRNAIVRDRAPYQPTRLSYSGGGYVRLPDVTWAGVTWVIRAERPMVLAMPDDGGDCFYTNTVEAVIPPLCPECRRDLGERFDIFNVCVWYCIACGWQKRSVLDFRKQAYEAVKLGKPKQ
jgi:hypothetical protein